MSDNVEKYQADYRIVRDATELELIRATAAHGEFKSRHEAIGVVREEYLEAEGETFKKRPDLTELAHEYIQLAAMAQRAIIDLGLVEYLK